MSFFSRDAAEDERRFYKVCNAIIALSDAVKELTDEDVYSIGVSPEAYRRLMCFPQVPPMMRYSNQTTGPEFIIADVVVQAARKLT